MRERISFYVKMTRLDLLILVKRAKGKYNFLIYSYCLMDNHVHLIINDNGNDISKVMKSINISYAMYFNRKNKRYGHLFQDRFRSEIIEDDMYLLEVSKYIHNNPVKAKMVEKAEDYKWSSYIYYINKQEYEDNLLDTSKILGSISNTKHNSIKEYIKYVNNQENAEIRVIEHQENYHRIEGQNRDYITSIEEAKRKVMDIAEKEGLRFEEITQHKAKRNEIIKEIRKNSSLTLKQIGEVFGGISESRICRILNNK